MGHRLGTAQQSLSQTEELSGRVLRLPFFYGIEQHELEYIAHVVADTLYTEHISATLERVQQTAPAEATSV
jgi:hypothetical protein